MNRFVKLFVVGVSCFVGYVECANKTLSVELSDEEITEVKNLLVSISYCPGEKPCSHDELDALIEESDKLVLKCFHSIERYKELLLLRDRLGNDFHKSEEASRIEKGLLDMMKYKTACGCIRSFEGAAFLAGCSVFTCGYRPALDYFVNCFSYRFGYKAESEVICNPILAFLGKLNRIYEGRDWLERFRGSRRCAEFLAGAWAQAGGPQINFAE
jgi:hypothetical protein